MKPHIILLLFSLFLLTHSQNSAPSSYLDIDDYQNNGDILIRTVRAPISTKTTYYCTLQFNAGAEGGGYTGIQDSPDNGRTFYYIFSLWDPSNHQKITAPYAYPGTKVENFGGEGTGLKAWNGQLGWTINEWYTLVLRRWDSVNQHTIYGWWVNDIKGNKWTHLVTMDYPVAGVYFNGGVSSFLEDWTDTGVNTRRFELRDGFKRTKDGVWHPFTRHRFSVNQGDTQQGGRSYNYRNAYDAGVAGNAVYYQTGGSTRNTCNNCYPTQNPGSQPQNPAISFRINQVQQNYVNWLVTPNVTPQFRYEVRVNGVKVAGDIDSERRSCNLTKGLKSMDVVEVVLEDILGRTSSQKTQFA